jgi:hypothetical protein
MDLFSPKGKECAPDKMNTTTELSAVEKNRLRCKSYYEAHKAERIKKVMENYEANKDRYKKQTDDYYQKNKDKISEQKATYYEKNKEMLRARQKAYREAKKAKASQVREPALVGADVLGD